MKAGFGLTARPRGHYVVDAVLGCALETGVEELARHRHRLGGRRVRKGDVIGIRDAEGQEFVRGSTNYAASEALQVRGLLTEDRPC